MNKEALAITRHLSTVAYEWFSTVYQEGNHSYALMAQTSAELEILWIKCCDKPFDFSKVQHVCVIQFQPQDKPKDVA